jgi:hypothetical protein
VIHAGEVEPELFTRAPGHGVEEAKLLKGAAAGAAAVGHHHVVEGFLLSTAAHQSDRHHRLPCLSESFG